MKAAALIILIATVRHACGASLQTWINYGRSSDSMVITWTSPLVTDVVEFAAVSGGPYSESELPDINTYSSPPVDGIQEGVYTSGLIHRLTLTNLATGVRVFYRIGSNVTGWSNESSFLTHPGVGPTVPVKMLVLADMDYECFDAKRCNPQSVVARLTQPGVLDDVNAGAVFCGDLAYSNGNQSHWDGWQAFIEPVSSQLPIMTNAGNHEMQSEPLFVPFKTRFGGMPYSSPAYVDSGALFYSYDVGGVHVIVLCAYSDYSDTSPQTVFLTNDLMAVNRSVTPWVIGVFHPPWYNSNTKHYLQHDDMRVAYESLLLQYRVNAVFVGHVHAFQRTLMVANNSVVAPETGAGLYHFMVGVSGKELYTTWRPESYPWMATRNATFWGAAYFIVNNATHATFEIKCFQGDGYACDPTVAVDSFTFTNQLLVNPLPTPTIAPSPSSEPEPPGVPDEPLSFAAALSTGTAIGGVGVLGVAFLIAHFSASKRPQFDGDSHGGSGQAVHAAYRRQHSDSTALLLKSPKH